MRFSDDSVSILVQYFKPHCQYCSELNTRLMPVQLVHVTIYAKMGDTVVTLYTALHAPLPIC